MDYNIAVERSGAVLRHLLVSWVCSRFCCYGRDWPRLSFRPLFVLFFERTNVGNVLDELDARPGLDLEILFSAAMALPFVLYLPY